MVSMNIVAAACALVGSAAAYPYHPGRPTRGAGPGPSASPSAIPSASPSAGAGSASGLNSTSSYNSMTGPGGQFEYQAPQDTDSRSPCPALNTLANHGFLPRDGRNLDRDLIMNGFMEGFGIAPSVLQIPLENFYTVCYYIQGSPCDKLTNLTILGEPHAFEHDHSISRQDYHMAYSNGAIDDNRAFNETVFQDSVNVLKGTSHMNVQQANEVRLQREAFSNTYDLPGWFKEERGIALTELGFVFALMSDFNLPDYTTNPQVNVEWWTYWFTNESFPTHLGWHKPSPPREDSFVTNISSSIEFAQVTSTPANLPTYALMSSSMDIVLPSTPLTTVFPLATNAPYKANGPVVKRDGSPASGAVPTAAAAVTPAAHVQRLASAESAMGPEPTGFNMYATVINRYQMAAQVNAKQARFQSVSSMMANGN